LFGATGVAFDRSFAGLERVWLDETAWIDHAAGWVTGADGLFAEVLRSRAWAQRTRWLWEKERVEPRLTSPWHLASGTPLAPAVLEDMRRALGQRYGLTFDSVGFNLYRDGRDSVAWHGDKIRRDIAEPVVALVSLGEPRRFLLRPRAGGRSRAWLLGGGDLFVTGGRTQRTWLHSVPKVARAGPRISIAFRHGMAAGAYGEPPGGNER
jgi:alkylated DNA repair dioxygenase AlkB